MLPDLNDAMARLNPQIRSLADRDAGGVIHNGKKERIGGAGISVEGDIKIGTAGERALAHVPPLVFLFRPVGGLVEGLCLARPVKRAKSDHSSGKHRGLRTRRWTRIDRHTNLAHAPILARAKISLSRVVPCPGLYREVLLLGG